MVAFRASRMRLPLDWAVDGGIGADNVATAVAAGANIIVTGRSVFKDGAIAQNIASLRAAISVARSI